MIFQAKKYFNTGPRKNLVLKRFLYRNFETKIKFGQQDFRAKSIWCTKILVHKTFGPKYILVINNFGKKNVGQIDFSLKKILLKKLVKKYGKKH